MSTDSYEIVVGEDDKSTTPADEAQHQTESLTAGPLPPTLEYEYSTPASDSTMLLSVALPSATANEVIQRLEDCSSSLVDSASPAQKRWEEAVMSAQGAPLYANAYVAPLVSPDRDWVTAVDGPTGPLRSSAPRVKRSANVKYTGATARRIARTELGLGGAFGVGLWHSGFWVRLRPPTEGAMLELYQNLTQEKAQLGRATYGLIFSGMGGYYSRILLDFVLEYVVDTSLILEDGEDIRNYIHVHDLPILYWGLACAHWSRGFLYSRPCVAKPGECSHVITETLNLREEMHVVDKRCLTAYQKQHMSKLQPRSVTTASLQQYQDEFLHRSPRLVNIDTPAAKIVITLKSPTARGHIQASYDWVNGIEELYPESLGVDVKTRQKFLLNQGRASLMRQYEHYVQSIRINDILLDDAEAISGTLEDMSGDEKIRVEFLKAVAKYIDDTVVSMIAIPSFICPSCGGQQNVGRPDTPHPNRIPLSVERLFFHLLALQVQEIETR